MATQDVIFDEWTGKSSFDIEEVRVNLQYFLTRTSYGRNYQNAMLGLSVLSCFQYIYSTYLPYDREIFVANRTELVIASIFLFDWLLALFVADNKLKQMFGFFSVVDIITVFPIFLTFGMRVPKLQNLFNATDIVYYALFGLGTTRILRALRLWKRMDFIEDPVRRCLGQIAVAVSVMMLFGSALILFLEKDVQTFDFHIWMYFICVTLTFVGIGDITPQTTLGRIAIMAMIGMAVIAIPKMSNELLELMELQSIYARLAYSAKGKKSRHIVVCGDLASISIREFFDELFHEDHDNDDLQVVILQPDEPSLEMLLLLSDPFLQTCVLFVQGSALIDKDLQRCHVENAVAVFVIANKFSPRADEEDARTILQWLSIKRYSAALFASSTVPTEAQKVQCPPFCLQLIRPENQRHIDANEVGRERTANSNIVICLNEIKMGILAKAIMFPGTNALIMNLISSFAEMDDDDDEADNEKNDAQRRKRLLKKINSKDRRGSIYSALNDAKDDDSSNSRESENSAGKKRALELGKSPRKNKEAWLTEYQQGCDWEIYCTSLSDVFQGCKFVDMSYLVFEHMRIVVFGIEIHELETDTKRILLNPGNYYLPREGYKIQVFVLAKNKAQADKLTNLSQMEELFFATAFHRQASQGRQYDIDGSASAGQVTGLKKATSSAKLTKSESSTSLNSEGDPVKPKKKYWKLLKRSNLLQKKIELDSFQEKLQKMEETHMSTYYYHRVTAFALEDCYVKTSVIDEVGHINNHLIITGKDLTNIYDLIRPLRAKYLGSLKYIVILYPDDIPHDVWRRICFFDAILVVRGSSLEEIDLRRAGIYRASQVVVLADASKDRPKNVDVASASEQDSLIDSDAIFTYQCVRRLNPHTHIVVEIVNQSNIAYLDNKEIIRDSRYKFTPQFASGSLFTTSLLDSLVCQAFYSPMIIDVVNKLISGIDHLDRGELESMALDAANDVSTPRSSDGKAKESSVWSSLPHEVPLKKIQGSCLYLVNIPDNLTKKTYVNLYRILARDNKIPLGLLRGIFSNMAVGPRSNRMPYVFTNPEADCEVFSCDRVFVLSMEALQANKLQVKDWILDIQMHKKLAEMSSSEDTSAKDLAAIRREYRHIQRVQRNLTIKFDGVADSLTKKFDVIVEIVAKGVAERVAMEEEILAKAIAAWPTKNRKASIFAGNDKDNIAKMIKNQWTQQLTAIDDKANEEYDIENEHGSRSRTTSEFEEAPIDEARAVDQSQQSTSAESVEIAEAGMPVNTNAIRENGENSMDADLEVAGVVTAGDVVPFHEGDASVVEMFDGSLKPSEEVPMSEVVSVELINSKNLGSESIEQNESLRKCDVEQSKELASSAELMSKQANAVMVMDILDVSPIESPTDAGHFTFDSIESKSDEALWVSPKKQPGYAPIFAPLVTMISTNSPARSRPKKRTPSMDYDIEGTIPFVTVGKEGRLGANFDAPLFQKTTDLTPSSQSPLRFTKLSSKTPSTPTIAGPTFQMVKAHDSPVGVRRKRTGLIDFGEDRVS